MQDEIMVLHTIQNIKKNYADKAFPKIDFENITSFDAPVDQIEFHFLIHKDSNYLKLLPKIDEAVRKMREEGELDRIRDKWIK